MSYIKLHRKVADHWVFKDARYFQIWMYLLFTANWKPSKRVVDGRLTEIPRGDVLTSLATIADATGNSIKVVRQFLTLAEMDTMVVTQRARRATWLTICNYETYQGDDIPSGHSNGTQTALKGISKGNTLRREEVNTPLTPLSGGGGDVDAVERLEQIKDRRAEQGKPKDLEEVLAYAQVIGCPEDKAMDYFGWFESTGWRAGKAAHPIRNWRLHFSTWWRQKRSSNG